MFRTIKKAQSGFTIIELLIVIAIIAILAGLVLNNFQGAQAKARNMQRQTDINNIHAKLEEKYNDTGSYPSTFAVADLPGIDAKALEDADNAAIVINAAVADKAAALAVADPDTTQEYLYIPYGCTGAACTGYVLQTFTERPDGVYTKESLNTN